MAKDAGFCRMGIKWGCLGFYCLGFYCHQAEAEQQLLELQLVARERSNIIEALMDAAKSCSLGSISHVLYEVGGEYRRNM